MDIVEPEMVALVVLLLHVMFAQMNHIVPDRLLSYDGFPQFSPVYPHSVTDDVVYCRKDEFGFGGEAEMPVPHHESAVLALLLWSVQTESWLALLASLPFVWSGRQRLKTGCYFNSICERKASWNARELTVKAFA
ncbi:MAG: hypothetical protein LBT40_17180 [Deltaproteobacteria bacterium]|nr:hypothetical protein [Deltaproteobacteria bacterium]